MSAGVLLGGLASVLHPGMLPQVEQAAMLGSGAAASAVPAGVRGAVAAALAAGGLGQSNPYARYDCGNSTFDISALARPGAWYAVRVRTEAETCVWAAARACVCPARQPSVDLCAATRPSPLARARRMAPTATTAH